MGATYQGLHQPQNLMQETLGLTSNHIYHCCLLLKEYGPEITYIKDVDITEADVWCRLKYDPKKHVKDLSMHT